MNIQEILSQHGVKCWEEGEHKNVRHGWIGTSCPWCGTGGKAHLGINLDGTYAVCWSCGYHRIGDVLMRLTNNPWNIVKDWLKGLQKAPGSSLEPPRPRGRYIMPPGLQSLRGPYKRYLENRGFSPFAIQQQWGVQATGPFGELAWRLWIPIHLDRKAVSWTTRAIGNRDPKYRSAGLAEETIPHKQMLYGLDYVGSVAIVVEGPTDAWAIGPGAVATLGITTTQEQFDLVAQVPKRVICFDSEPAAQRRGKRLADQLSLLPGETYLVELESGADPAKADKKEIKKLRERFLQEN